MKEKLNSTFAEFLATLRKGKTIMDLARHMQTVAKAVQDTGKKGQIQLTIDLVPDKHIQDNKIVHISDKIKATIPESDRGATIFWIGQDGELSRTDPAQYALEGLKEVDEESRGELKEVAD